MMLNTTSRFTATLVWLAILAIAARFTWTLFALGQPAEVLGTIADSRFADIVSRNQVLATGLTGFGAAIVAYLFNGWRDRAERRHVAERHEKRLVGVLAREAETLAGALEHAAAAGAAGRSGGSVRERFAAVTDTTDSILLAAPITELARLGPGATSAIQAVRSSLRRFASHIGPGDESGERRLLASALEAACAARDTARVLGTLAEKGPAAADRIRLLPRSDADIAALMNHFAAPAQPTRLLPVA